MKRIPWAEIGWTLVGLVGELAFMGLIVLAVARSK